MLVGLVMDVVLVSLLAPVAVAGRKRKVPKTGMFHLNEYLTAMRCKVSDAINKKKVKFLLFTMCMR